MKDVNILLVKPSTPLVMDALDAAFTLHRLDQQDDPDAWLAEHGDSIRGIVSSASFALDGALMDKLPNLEIASNFGVGYDNVDVAAARDRGVMVTHTRSVLDEEVADTALALILMTLRNLIPAERYVRSGEWEAKGAFPLGKYTMKGSVLGIVGLGRIGKEIARRAEAFGMQIAYTGRRKQDDQPYAYHASVTDLAAEADVLLNCAPGGAGTFHMIDAGVLAALGPDGILINIGRGTTVDETALIAALRDGTIAGAGLDVFETEPNVPEALRKLENTVLLPHIGSATIPTRDAMGQLVVDNLTNWFDKGSALTPVPECAKT